MPNNLPNLIMPGAQKSGTTYLAALLAQHPRIFVPVVKEPAHFLATTHPRVLMHNGEERRYAYCDRDDYGRLYAGAGDAAWRVDASTGYFAQPEVIRTIRETCGPTRIVSAVRQPAERAHSAFIYNRQTGVEAAETIEEAIAAERALMTTGVVPQPYLETGYYARHLAAWQNAFGADQVLPVVFEDIRKDPQGVVDRITDFLELPRHVVDLAVEKNVSHRPMTGWRGRVSTLVGGSTRETRLHRGLRSMISPEMRHRLRTRLQTLLRPPPGEERPDRLSPEKRASLTQIFMDDIGRLEEMTGFDLSEWKK